MRLTYRALAIILTLIALIFTVFPGFFSANLTESYAVSSWLVTIALVILLMIIVGGGGNRQNKIRRLKKRRR